MSAPSQADAPARQRYLAVGAGLDGRHCGTCSSAQFRPKDQHPRMVNWLADERVDELTTASLLSWTKGKARISAPIAARSACEAAHFGDVTGLSRAYNSSSTSRAARTVGPVQVARDLLQAARRR
jgi:hypothetical protein